MLNSSGNILATGLSVFGNINVSGNINFGGYYQNSIRTEGTIAGIEITSGLTLGNISARIDYANEGFVDAPGMEIGFRNIPQVSAGNVTLAINVRGKHVYSTSTAPTTLTVPSNANVAFPTGTVISIVNKGTGNVTLALEVEVSMYLAGNAITSTRTITSYGMATVMKTNTNEWFINGFGVV